MLALTGPDVTRPHETVALVVTALAAMAAVIVPSLYVLALPAACGVSAAVAPVGRRTVAAMAVWLPVSAAVVLGLTVA